MNRKTLLRTMLLSISIAALSLACDDDSANDDGGGAGSEAGSGGASATAPGGGGGGGAGGNSSPAAEGAFLTLFCTDACSKDLQCNASEFNANFDSLEACIAACEDTNAALADESVGCQGAITAQASCYNGLSCDAFNAAQETGAAEACEDADAAIEVLCGDILGSGIPGFSGSGIPGMSGSGIPGFTDSGIPGFTDSGIPGFTDSGSSSADLAALLEQALDDYCTQHCGILSACSAGPYSTEADCLFACPMSTASPDAATDGRAARCAELVDALRVCELTAQCSDFVTIYEASEFTADDLTCGEEFIDLNIECST